ncbi:MAG: chromate transporter [Clostridia bacterium]|nr:chromate transporter [Clostridia bacterium]
MTFLKLFFEFFKIGLFAVGGGPATIPFLQDLARSDYGWFNEDQLGVMVAIAESTPGPIGVNMATYAGYNAGFGEFGVIGGILGGITATMGLVTPSVIVIILVAGFLKAFKENTYVKGAFSGIRPVVTALVLFAVFGIIKPIFFVNGEFVIPVIAISVVVFGLMFIKKLKKLHPAFWLVLGAVAGILLKL